jgi:hypothetical protein
LVPAENCARIASIDLETEALKFGFATAACAIPLGGGNRYELKVAEDGSSSVEGAILFLFSVTQFTTDSL